MQWHNTPINQDGICDIILKKYRSIFLQFITISTVYMYVYLDTCVCIGIQVISIQIWIWIGSRQDEPFLNMKKNTTFLYFCRQYHYECSLRGEHGKLNTFIIKFHIGKQVLIIHVIYQDHEFFMSEKTKQQQNHLCEI